MKFARYHFRALCSVVSSHLLRTKVFRQCTGEVPAIMLDALDDLLLTRHHLSPKAPEWKRAYMYVFFRSPLSTNYYRALCFDCRVTATTVA
jgi:hypothetical protein